MSTVRTGIVALLLAGAAACHHPGPIAGGTKAPESTGTISGIVSSVGGTGLPGRKVTAVEVASNDRHDATTGADGGYTIKVPPGHYRLELALTTGESLQTRPPEVHITRSDLDAGRNFVVANSR
jgi:hypothetical protein